MIMMGFTGVLPPNMVAVARLFFLIRGAPWVRALEAPPAMPKWAATTGSWWWADAPAFPSKDKTPETSSALLMDKSHFAPP